MTHGFISQAPSLPDYIFGDKIGSGSYGTVYKAVHKGRETSSGSYGTQARVEEVVAIKCLRKASLSASSRDNLISEISALKKLHHPHIVAMHDFRWDASHIFIIMEYCGGDLASYLRKHHRIQELVARDFLQQLASALAYMQRHRVSHLDLKPSNILLTHSACLKIADFGFAQHWKEATQVEDIRGSLLYMAPEMVVNGCYDPKADLWSVGVILYECLFGRAPFLSSSLKELHDKIKSEEAVVLPTSPTVSSQCKQLLNGLLLRDPSLRTSFSHFFLHPFLHLPSLLSRAEAMVREARWLRRKGDDQGSFDTYCDAVQCYVFATKCEKNEVRKNEFRRKVHEYIEIAEELKTLLKEQHLESQQQQNVEQQKQNCELQQQKHQNVEQQQKVQQKNVELQQQQRFDRQKMQQQPSPPDPIEELSFLWQGNQHVKEALNVIKSAELKMQTEQPKSALERYELAIGVLLKLVKDEPPSRRQELMHSQLSGWLDRADDIKKHLAASRTKVEGGADDGTVDRTSCVLQ